jgi:hypothetical protein
LNLEIVRALVDACIARLTPLTHVEAPTAPATGRPPGYGVLAAKVREALAASPGSTCAALAKAVGAKPKHVDKALKRLVSQGKARKEGRTYVLQKGYA